MAVHNWKLFTRCHHTWNTERPVYTLLPPLIPTKLGTRYSPLSFLLTSVHIADAVHLVLNACILLGGECCEHCEQGKSPPSSLVMLGRLG